MRLDGVLDRRGEDGDLRDQGPKHGRRAWAAASRAGPPPARCPRMSRQDLRHRFNVGSRSNRRLAAEDTLMAIDELRTALRAELAEAGS
jgi:hypothetical protein